MITISFAKKSSMPSNRMFLVIPVLVDNATMPRADQLPPDLRPLCAINALVAGSDIGENIDRLARALRDDLTVRTPAARASGTLLYTWTGFFGLIAFSFVAALADCSAGQDAEGSVLPLIAVGFVFALAFGIIVSLRRAMRARRDAKRVVVTVLLYIIAPIAAFFGIWLGVGVDPNL